MIKKNESWNPTPARLVALAAMGAMVFSTACSKEEEAPAPQPVQRKAVVKQVDPLENLQLDPRVQFPRERAPASPEQAKAVADLANAVATGDDSSLSGMLDRPMRAVLEDLVASGDWGSSTSGIEVVRVVSLEGDDTQFSVGLGVQDPDGAYLLAWEGRAEGDTWIFSGLAAEDVTAPRASDLDGASLVAVGVPTPGSGFTEASVEELLLQKRADDKQNKRGRRGRGRRGGGSRRAPRGR